VYKNGQAGVTKASVTIVFDNSDTKLSPVGYEHCKEIAVTRQVVVGGRNKHMINGRTVRSNQVHNLFHSVQLDVNNPHFLIMQGRIVKMMNMKPLEVLGLIEEAGGTRMFERKKEASLKIIQKKERKVEEINKIIKDEISPTLEKLQKDRAAYREYTENQMHIERAKRQSVAYSYYKMKQSQERHEKDCEKHQEKIQTLELKEKEKQEESKNLGEEIKKLQEEKSRVMEGDFKKLQEEENQCSKRLVKVNSMWQNKRDTLKSETKAHKQLEKQCEESKSNEIKAKKELERHDEKSKVSIGKLEEIKTKLSECQKQLQALNAGIADDAEGNEKNQSLSQRLLEARGAHKDAKSTIDQLKITQKHRRAERKKTEKELNAAKKKNASLAKALQRAQKEVARITAKISDLSFDEKEMNSLEQEVERREVDLSSLDERVEALSAKLASFIDFKYSKPSAKFNRSSVKGLLGRLLKVEDESMMTAVETVAGGKLYQLVVDTVQTGKALLKKGKLKNRVTIIPLDKIKSGKLPDKAKLKQARDASSKVDPSSNVQRALDLVKYVMMNILSLSLSLSNVIIPCFNSHTHTRIYSFVSLRSNHSIHTQRYDEEYHNAMEYVFGKTLVCDTMKSARAVTFDKKIRLKTVTKEGDSLDPNGVMSGGSKSSRRILASLHKLDMLLAERKNVADNLKPLRERLETLRDAGARFRALNEELELKKHELSLVQKRCETSRFASLQQSLAKIDEQLKSIETEISNAKLKATEQDKLAKSLKKEIENFEETRKAQLKAKESEIASLKKQISKSEKACSKLEQERQLHALELEQLQKDIEGFTKQIEKSQENLNGIRDEVKDLADKVEKERETYTNAKKALDAQSKAMSDCDKKSRSLQKSRNQAESKIATIKASMKKCQNSIKRLKEDCRISSDTMTKLKKEHAWIAAEEQFFGQTGSDYDFKSTKVGSLDRQLNALEKKQSELSKRINHKVMGMIEKAESDYAELKKKREIIKRDKDKIMATIEELMERKNRALRETYDKVNRDFGSMFATFLPGTQAELRPVDGTDIFKGLLPRVAFGGKWKESLMELSGGQCFCLNPHPCTFLTRLTLLWMCATHRISENFFVHISSSLSSLSCLSRRVCSTTPTLCLPQKMWTVSPL